MRIHDLEITGLGPYAGTESIDFDGLNEAGVLLLSGPTGSGKTTVLDAVCYAIYGTIPRAASGDEIVSDHREPSTTPEVVLDFTVAGSRFRVTRRPKHLRPKKKKAEELTDEKQFVKLEKWQHGDWQEDSTGWNEANERLCSLVGMDAGQFHQLVLLPQGKFARFLESDVKDRKKLMESLFPGNDLAYVEGWLKARARRDGESRDKKLGEINDQLQQATPAFQELSKDLEAEGEEPLADIPPYDEPGPVADWTETISKAMEARAGITETAMKAGRASCAEAEARFAAATKKRELIGKRSEAEALVAELEARTDWREQSSARCAAGDRAAGVVPLVRHARKAADDADGLERQLELASAELRSDEMAGTDEEPALKTILDEAGKQVAAIDTFENEDLPRRRELDEQTASASAELEVLEGGGPETELARCESALKEADEAREAAKLALIEIRNARTAGMAAELAADLEDGESCPVCGSTDHPGANHADSPPVAKQEEDEAAHRDTESELRLGRARQARDTAAAEASNRIEKLKDTIKRAAKEREELTEKERELASGEPSTAARKEKLEALIERIEGFLGSVQKAADARTGAADSAAAAEAEAASQGFQTVGDAESASIDPKELASLKAKVAEHDEKLNQALGLLNGELLDVDPDETVDLEPLEAAVREAVRRRDDDVGLHKTASDRLRTFQGVTSEIPALFDELVPLREAASCSAELHRLASGDNERRMKLSTYVLAVRLRQVIQAANRHLRLMSNGRYELVYSGDVAAHGATSGLGIKVFDSNTSGTRSTGTLSGGESFYASLSLALGLAEVVQQETGGKPLETLFIDEGFGTLDAKTLDQVMDVIDDLREGGRTVGLVSHVDELRNRVTARIEVSPTSSGSTLEVVGV